MYGSFKHSMLVKQILELEHYLSINHEVKIICLNEHWLNEAQLQSTGVANYQLVSYYCRSHLKHGGCCIYVHKNIPAIDLNFISNFSVEQICEICACYCQNLNLAIISVYRSCEFTNVDNFLGIMLQSILKIDTKLTY